MQSYAGGIEKLSVDTIAPIFRRGVLLDIAGPAILPEDFEITPAHLLIALSRASESDLESQFDTTTSLTCRARSAARTSGTSG